MKKSIVLIVSVMSIHTIGLGQIENKELLIRTHKRLDSVSVESIATDYLLNKGFFFGQFIAKMKSLGGNDQESQILFMNSPQWRSFYMGVVKSGIGEKKSQINPELVLEKYEDKASNKVTLGIIFTKGEWLEPEEIEENINAVKVGSGNSKEYKQVTLVGAAPLQNEALGTSIEFEIPEELFIVENKDVSVEIDLSDGTGFRKITKGDRLSAIYAGGGERALTFKFTQGKNVVSVFSKFMVTVFDDTEPDYIFELGGVEEYSEDPSKARILSLSGGQAVLYNGCDRIFDKPVIIVEGFDPLNEFNANNLRAKYITPVENRFRANGYDMIYLNFSNGGATIQTNAAVLEQLLIDVKSKKVGTHPITVIGESMGGLVARYCLRNMETKGIVHGVDKFISYDSPHLGANVPVGIQKLVEDIYDVDIRNLFNIAQADLDKALTYLNSPAARQMMLRYKSPNPHADFTALQNTFGQMGFPSQNNIKKIAIINGSTVGTQQSPVNNFAPGDMMFKVDLFTGLANAVIKLRTNNINASTTVSSIWITVGPIPTTIKDRTFSFNAFNYDISAGGHIETTDYFSADQLATAWKNFLTVFTSLISYGSFQDFGRTQFSFVPLFSAVASTAPRTSQAHLNRTVSQLQSNGWTSFQTIYSTNNNTMHVSNTSISPQWVSLLSNEFGINSTFCTLDPGTMSPPPVPQFNTTQWYMCPNQSLNFWITNGSTVSNLYSHRWEVTGPNNYFYNLNSDNLTLSYLNPGSYTITLIRSYSGGAYSNISTMSSRVITVFPASDPVYCSGGGGGPIQRILDDGNQEISPREINERLQENALIDEGSIRFWPNPASGTIRIAMAAQEGTRYSISIVPAAHSHSRLTVLKEGSMSGEFEDGTYDVSHLKPGLYIIEIQTDLQVVRKRVIIR